MARHIHVHVHGAPTTDAWEESKHPRADDGKFGVGKGAAAAFTKKRVRDPMEGTHTVITYADGRVHRIQKLNATESMGLPGYHDMDAPDGKASFLADTEEEAIKELDRRKPAKSATPSPHSAKEIERNGRESANATPQERRDAETARKAKLARLRAKPGYKRLPGEVD